MKKKTGKEVTAAVKTHVKGISAIVVGYGVAEIVGSVLKEYKPEAKGLHKMLIKIGAVALTGMVIKKVTDYVDGEIDDIFEMGEEFANHVSAITEETNDTDEEVS